MKYSHLSGRGDGPVASTGSTLSMSCFSWSSESALTLMEVLVALIILSVGLLAVLKGSGENQDALIVSREMTEVGMLGQNLMETIGAVGLEEWSEWQGTFDPPYDRYRWEFEILSTDVETLDTGMLTIRHSIDQTRALVLEELFFRQGR